MSRLDKLAEEFQRKIKQVLKSDNKTESEKSSADKLTASEVKDLNKELSGEEITKGFTEAEAEELTKNLSGDRGVSADLMEYTTTDEAGNKQSVTFYGDSREGMLDLTQDSLEFYRDKYPNVAKAYLSGGVVTLLDSSNNAILDSNGKPVTVDYSKVKDSPSLNLVSFYINHSGGELDINKMFELQALQEQMNSTPETDSNYQVLMSEIEIQKLDMMSEEERKNSITTKMWNAFNNGDKTALFNALSEFYEYECRVIDRKLGITGTKEFIKEKTHLNDLVDYINKVLDDNTAKLTKTELAWEIIKGVGDAIDSFIGTQGLTMVGVLGSATKAASAIPKLGPWLAGAIQAYFGVEGLTLIGSGTIDGYNAETKEQARGAGAELGLGGIMAKGGLKSFKAGFKNLELKTFRSKISESKTLEELDVIREIIEESSYSKAEKAMLQNECAKQQGVIQSNWKEVRASAKESPLYHRTVYDEKVNDQDTRIKLSYRLFKICKTPAQKEMAKLILSDKRLYLSNKAAFDLIVENCTTQENVNMYMQFMSKLLSSKKFQVGSEFSPKGAVDEYLLTYAGKNLKPELFDIQLKILDAYAQNNVAMKLSDFGYLMHMAIDMPSCTKFLEFLQNEKLYRKKLEPDEITNLGKIAQCGSDIPLEQIYSSSDAKAIASLWLKNSKLINLCNTILQDEALYNGEPIYLKNGTLLSNYGDRIASVLNICDDYVQMGDPYHIRDFVSRIVLNEGLRKDNGVLESLNKILKRKQYKLHGYTELIEELFSIYEKKEIKDFTSDKIGAVSEYLYDNYKPLDKTPLKDKIVSFLSSFDKIYTNFTSGREYSSENVTDLYKYLTKGCPKDIIMQACKDKDLSANNIILIADYTTEKTVDFTGKLLKATRLTADEKVNIIMSVGSKPEMIKIAELLLEESSLDTKVIQKILKTTKILDENDAGGNNGNVDPKKVDKYLRLLQSPKTRDWTIKMLNEGWDIETISRLAATKQNFYMNREGQASVTDKNVSFFMDFGLNAKEADAIVKAISQNGVVNTEMQKTAVDLINSGIPKHKIGQIMSSATISGDYNARVPADAMALNGLGLNAFVERYLPVLNNMDAADVAVKFNAKTKKQLKTMIENISEETKPALRAKGFDLEGILKKLDSKGLVQKTENGRPQKVLDGLRNRADITGFERILIDKYNPAEKVWRSPEETKSWAEEKYQSFKNSKYISARDTGQTKAEEVNRQRAEGLRAWFDFMETEEELKTNPFARVLLSEFITKDLLPENSSIPPVLDKAAAKKVLADALKEGSSFEKGYRAELNNIAKQSSGAKEVKINGRKMTWYTVPQTDNSHPEFNANVAKVRALSDGTNWCIRTLMADNYVQEGNIHFLVDETGMTQVCVREGSKGKIAEIQKRQQTQSVPVAYVDFIQQFVKSKKLKGCEDKIKEALKQKPEFDKTRDKLQELAAKKDYKAILEMLGIDVNVLPDGSWEISHYTSYLNEVALNDYGISENDLLANVSKIKGNAKFKDSNATSLPNLQEVGGELNFGYSDISNLQNLKKIKGRKINW